MNARHMKAIKVSGLTNQNKDYYFSTNQDQTKCKLAKFSRACFLLRNFPAFTTSHMFSLQVLIGL